jgi:hypothetical protein
LASYNPYQSLYGREPILLNSIRKKLAHVVDLDDPNIWAECLQEWAQSFQRAMPMVMENLSITQHRICIHIHSSAYRPQLRRSWQGDYVYLQRDAPTTLDVRAERTILRVIKVLPSGLLLLEGNDGRECREHSKNCASNHLSIDGTVHSELAVVPEGFPCLFVERKKERLLCSCVISLNMISTWHV